MGRSIFIFCFAYFLACPMEKAVAQVEWTTVTHYNENWRRLGQSSMIFKFFEYRTNRQNADQLCKLFGGSRLASVHDFSGHLESIRGLVRSDLPRWHAWIRHAPTGKCVVIGDELTLHDTECEDWYGFICAYRNRSELSTVSRSARHLRHSEDFDLRPKFKNYYGASQINYDAWNKMNSITTTILPTVTRLIEADRFDADYSSDRDASDSVIIARPDVLMSANEYSNENDYANYDENEVVPYQIYKQRHKNIFRRQQSADAGDEANLRRHYRNIIDNSHLSSAEKPLYIKHVGNIVIAVYDGEQYSSNTETTALTIDAKNASDLHRIQPLATIIVGSNRNETAIFALAGAAGALTIVAAAAAAAAATAARKNRRAQKCLSPTPV